MEHFELLHEMSLKLSEVPFDELKWILHLVSK